MFLIMGSLSGLAAFGLLVGAVWSYFSQRRKMAGRAAGVGTVVELTTQTTASGRASILCPIVEFTSPSGEVIRFTSDFGSRPASHKIGQSVPIRYDPVDPRQAEIESRMTLWLAPLILVFMGALACCLAVAFLGIYGLGLSPQ